MSSNFPSEKAHEQVKTQQKGSQQKNGSNNNQNAQVKEEISVEKFIWIPEKLRQNLIATRPWSFPASLLSVFIPGIIVMVKEQGTMLSSNFIIVLFMTLAGHCLANLLNTYYDFVFKVDNENSDDRGLLDKLIDLATMDKFIMGLISFISLLLGVLVYQAPRDMLVKQVSLFAALIFITLFYTSKAFSIKYIGRGISEICIFLVFGPLLGQFVAVSMTGDYDFDVLVLSVPNGLLTVNILHANNQRDISSDIEANIRTGAYYLGENSQTAYKLIFLVSYLLPILYAFQLKAQWLNFYRSLPLLLCLPMTINLCKCFSAKNYHELPQKTAQHNVLFGLLQVLSVLPLDGFGQMLLG